MLVVALRRELGTRIALLAGLVLAFGTATWSVSADTLWPHGPDQFFLAATMLLLSRNRRVLAACAAACAVFVRAHLAAVSLVFGVWLAIRERSVKPLIVFGAPALVALGLLSLYNHVEFHTWQLQGAYPYINGDISTLNGVGGQANIPVNLLGALFSLNRGLVIWCPVAVVLATRIRPAWRRAPDWVRLSAVGGLLYMLIQLKLNYFSGGSRFWSYRLTIEPLTLSMPLLAYAAAELRSSRPWLRRTALAATLYGVGTQAIGAVFFVPPIVKPNQWTYSALGVILQNGGNGPRAVMAATVVAVAAAFAWPRRRGPDRAAPTALADAASA
jgi:alpha-1,2-mannosyltransferase